MFGVRVEVQKREMETETEMGTIQTESALANLGAGLLDSQYADVTGNLENHLVDPSTLIELPKFKSLRRITGRSRAEVTIAQLAQSILQEGQGEPCGTYPTPDGIVLYSGHRRKEAVELLRSQGHDIPLLIRVQELTEEEAYRKALILNIQRENHTAHEFGDIIAAVRAAHHWEGSSNTSKVAEYLCVSVATVIQYEKFMRLPEDIRQMVSEERMTLSAALDAASSPEEKMMGVVERAKELAEEEQKKKAEEKKKEEEEQQQKSRGRGRSGSGGSGGGGSSEGKKKVKAEPLRVPEPEWMKEERKEKKEKEKALQKAHEKAEKEKEKAEKEREKAEAAVEAGKQSGRSQEAREKLEERLAQAVEREQIAAELEKEVQEERERLEKEKDELRIQKEEFEAEVAERAKEEKERLEAEALEAEAKAKAETAAVGTTGSGSGPTTSTPTPVTIEARHIRRAQREIPGALVKLKAPKMSDLLLVFEDTLDTTEYTKEMRLLGDTISRFGHGKVDLAEVVRVWGIVDEIVRAQTSSSLSGSKTEIVMVGSDTGLADYSSQNNESEQISETDSDSSSSPGAE